ncbi:MAG TPA: hypothetical protein VEW93_12745 [Acidimicrobiales bacterium]|nr:hypothetical protein [Acidimicrobiales bacterium]
MTFGSGAAAVREGRLATLGERARPLTLAEQRVLPVLSALAPLLPGGALARGTSVAVAGPGATSLALGLAAAASAAGSWTAVVGVGDLGVAAAAEAGLALERTVLVATPPPERWGTVVAAVAETVELVLARPPARVRVADTRRLAAHLRTRGGVLVRLPGPGTWPEAPDVTLRALAPDWKGAVAAERLDGAGRLRARRLVVEASGRRRAARPTRVELWLPGADGAPAPVVPVPVGSAPTVPAPASAPAPAPAPAVARGPAPAGWAEAG